MKHFWKGFKRGWLGFHAMMAGLVLYSIGFVLFLALIIPIVLCLLCLDFGDSLWAEFKRNMERRVA